MHLVFINQYYPPDVAPTGVMLAGVVRQLVRDGHEVTVLCASGGYAKEVAAEAVGNRDAAAGDVSGASRLHVVRIGATRFGRGTAAGKMLDYASYYAGVAWKLLLLTPRPVRLVALTTPPYLSILARALSRLRGGDHAHWVMDLYPDVMVAHGMLTEGGWLRRGLAVLARWGFGGRRCAAVLTLGPDMAARIGPYLAVAMLPKVAWVPLWGLETQNGSPEEDGAVAQAGPAAASAGALRAERGWSDDELVVMYSGNMGLGHRFAETLDAALAMRGEPVRWVYYGDGRRRREIEEFMRAHPEGRVELYDYAPASLLDEHLRSADLHLASLDPAWTGTMVPSKLQGIFAAGRPVVFIGSETSSIGQWIVDSGGGWIVQPGDVNGLLSALGEAREPAERARRGQAAGAFAVQHFNAAANISQVAAILTRDPPTGVPK